MVNSHCLECVKNDEDCCSSFYSRFATLGDAQRISSFLGKKPSQFLKFAELSECDRRTDLYSKKHHPYYYDLVKDGRLLQLKAKKSLACMFFRKGHCAIYPARPLGCKVFPFWFSEKGKIIVDNNGFDCPIVCGKTPLSKNPSAAAIRKGICRICYSEKELKSLIRQLAKEIEEYKAGVAEFVKRNKI